MLILDDEPLFRETLAEVFSGQGFFGFHGVEPGGSAATAAPDAL